MVRENRGGRETPEVVNVGITENSRGRRCLENARMKGELLILILRPFSGSGLGRL